MALYVETSAVLAWIFGEPAGAHAVTVMNSISPVVSSTLTVLETERAIRRALHRGDIREADAAKLQRLARIVQSGWELMEITPEVQRRAAESFPAEPVRSLDALHLASILAFLELYDEITVISFDSRILNNIALLGISAA